MRKEIEVENEEKADEKMEIDEAVVPEEQSVPTGHQIVVSP